MSALVPRPSSSPRPAPSGGRSRECLSFKLGDEHYGIDILCVQELRGYETPTHIAGAHPSVLGVLNLRGVVVPVVDLRMRFGVEAKVDTLTVTAVLNVGGRTIGAVVDAVSDVVELQAQQIQPPPQFSTSFDTRCINGIGNIRQGDQDVLLQLLDVEQLMGSAELGLSGPAAA